MTKIERFHVEQMLRDLDAIVWSADRIDAKGPDHLVPYTETICDRVRAIKARLLGAASMDIEVEAPAETAP